MIGRVGRSVVGRVGRVGQVGRTVSFTGNVKYISPVTGTLSRSEISRTQQRMPPLNLRRLPCCAHVVPMLKLLRTGTVQTQTEPTDHLPSFPRHASSSSIVNRQEERYVPELEQSNLRKVYIFETIHACIRPPAYVRCTSLPGPGI